MTVRILVGDCLDRLRELDDGSVHCCVTSPPYWGLRDYGTGEWEGGDESCDHKLVERVMHAGRQGNPTGTPPGAGRMGDEYFRDLCGKCGARRVDRQLGLEASPEEYVARMVDVFREVRRVMRDDATLWLNLGDSYSHGGNGSRDPEKWPKQSRNDHRVEHAKAVCGAKPKDLLGVPWRLAFALQADGWWLRSDIIWSKPAPMPESVRDRPPKSHEYLFLLTKRASYYYDATAIMEPHSPDGRKVTTVTAGDGSAQHRDGERWPGAGRNKRSVWTINAEPFSARELGGDIGRTTSPDCPVHGVRSRQACASHDDAQRAASVPLHIPCSDDRLYQEPLGESCAIGLDPVEGRASSSSAIRHSTETSRTDEALGPRDTGVAQSADDTACMSQQRDLFSMSDRSRGNRSGADYEVDARGFDPSAETLAGTFRTPCTCKYTDHFAVFPTALVEPCVKAGTSERGVCPDCGAPWERETERTAMVVRATPKRAAWQAEDGHARTQVGGTMLEPPTSRTTGWRPTCDHQHAPVPATVLDPFGGAGTTGYVAQALGRDAILIELNPTYADLARKRMGTWNRRRAELAQLAIDGAA